VTGDDGQRARAAGHIRRRLVPAAIVAVVGTGLSVFAFWQLHELELRNIRDQFRTSSEQYAEAIRHGIDRKMLAMEALRSVFDA